MGSGVGAWVGENVSPKLVGADVDGGDDGEVIVDGVVSRHGTVCPTTREPTTVAQSNEGLLATLV